MGRPPALGVSVGSPERRGVDFAKDGARYPWAFAVRDVRLYFDSKVVIDAALRFQLDAFVKHGHDPNGSWSWMVQGTRCMTAHDFALLTRRQAEVDREVSEGPLSFAGPHSSPISSFQTSGCLAMNSRISATHASESRLTTSTPRARR